MKKDNKVLLIGSGGREHAILEALSRSPFVSEIFVARGNAGMRELASLLPIDETDFDALISFALKEKIDLTVVGPELPLSLGIVDRFRAEGLRIFGPSQAAAQIESSKDFAKSLMMEAEVPTANYQSFTDYNQALSYVQEKGFPIVLKYDGLAAGKGVIIAQNLAEADATLKDMLLEDKFGLARVVIEDFLLGEEFSLFAFVRGREVYPLSPAKDHKRAFDGDKGPNTGGMGAYSPVPFVTSDDETFVLEHVLKPTASALVNQGASFTGLLYAGLIKTSSGIKVIEFNCRFGDPETEVLLPRLKTDLFEVMLAIAEGNEKAEAYETSLPPLEWEDFTCLGIVYASQGYPEAYRKGVPIAPLPQTRFEQRIYHMGTRIDADGQLLSNGGRVLMFVALDESPAIARQKVLSSLVEMNQKDFFFRSDIGKEFK